MPWWGILILVILGLLVAFVAFAYFYGNKMRRKQAEAEKQMAASKQTVSLLVIDKQKKKLKEAGLPEQVYEQAPKYMRRMKMPVVKVKIGPRVMNLLADNKVYEVIPVKKTCTVSISGIYITEIKSVRGGSVPKLPEKKKGGLLSKLKLKKEKADK